MGGACGACHVGGGGDAGGFHGALVGGPGGIGLEVAGPHGAGDGGALGGGGAGAANDDGAAVGGPGGVDCTCVGSLSPGVSIRVSSTGGAAGAKGAGGASGEAARGWPQPVQKEAEAGTSVPQLEHAIVSLTRTAFLAAGGRAILPDDGVGG